jgi:hypothetical protein
MSFRDLGHDHHFVFRATHHEEHRFVRHLLIQQINRKVLMKSAAIIPAESNSPPVATVCVPCTIPPFRPSPSLPVSFPRPARIGLQPGSQGNRPDQKTLLFLPCTAASQRLRFNSSCEEICYEEAFAENHSRGQEAIRSKLGRVRALILALIAVVAILVLQGLGNKVNNTLSSVNANLP